MLETFQGSDLRRVMDDVRRALGDDALVIRSHVDRRGSRTVVEVLAASDADLATLKQRLAPPAPFLPSRHGGRGQSGPFIVAFVGPGGAGKSTTLVKLALNPRAFDGARVGLLTLDTFRVGALDQIQQYADLASLHLEAVYDEREVVGALQRLDECDVVLVDTPGRSPRDANANALWQSLLLRLAPDETHLVLPVTLRMEGVAVAVKQYAGCKPTHLLPTKTDEAASDIALVELVGHVELPMRWVTTGQAVPDDIRPARARVLNALGVAASDTPGAVAAIAA